MGGGGEGGEQVALKDWVLGGQIYPGLLNSVFRGPLWGAEDDKREPHCTVGKKEENGLFDC